MCSIIRQASQLLWKLIQMIKANLSSVWRPLQQLSCSPPWRHNSLSDPRKQQRTEESEGGTRGGDCVGTGCHSQSQLGHRGRSCSAPAPNISRALNVFIVTGMMNSVGEIIPSNPGALNSNWFLSAVLLLINSMHAPAYRELNGVHFEGWQDSNHSRPANISDGIFGAGF